MKLQVNSQLKCPIQMLCRKPFRRKSAKGCCCEVVGERFKVVIFDEPTRGIDVAAKVEIYNLMNQLKQQGIGVLFTSSEMPEILGISDRMIVMCDGRITGELNTAEATQNKILEYATRFEKKLESEQSA